MPPYPFAALVVTAADCTTAVVPPNDGSLSEKKTPAADDPRSVLTLWRSRSGTDPPLAVATTYSIFAVAFVMPFAVEFG